MNETLRSRQETGSCIFNNVDWFILLARLSVYQSAMLQILGREIVRCTTEETPIERNLSAELNECETRYTTCALNRVNNDILEGTEIVAERPSIKNKKRAKPARSLKQIRDNDLSTISR